MPPSRINLDPWRDTIAGWIRDGLKQDEICEELQAIGVSISDITLRRRLKEWNIKVNRPPVEHILALRARITEIFHSFRLTDEETLQILEIDGFKVGHRKLGIIRRELGLKKRLDPLQHEAIEAAVRDVLQQELDQGHIEDLGRRNLYSYMRSKYNVIGRYVHRGVARCECAASHLRPYS